MAQLSDDCFAPSGKLLTLKDALDLLSRTLVTVTDTETVPLRCAGGRVLTEDVVAPRDVPPHDNSAVDGYGVHFEDLDRARQTRLPVRGRVAAGHPLARGVPRGEAVRIFTGAPMPPGVDTVMMQEDCRAEGDTVCLMPGIERGANVRRRGEDIAAGNVVLHAGIRLRPQDIGLAASVGRRQLEVSRPLRVALFSTGDELREPGQPLDQGCIYDVNRYTVATLLTSLGASVTDLGILEDRRDVIQDALAEAAEGHDLVITSGGVSVGEEDHVKAAVEALGRLHFWQLAIKPGRPIALGQLGRVPFVGLPGNPVSVMVTFLRVVRPLVLRLMGCDAAAPVHYRVRAGFAHRKKPNRREWVRARLEVEGGEPVAVKFPRQGSGILTSMAQSDGLVELPEDLTRLEAGAMVDFLPFREVDA
ncbi:MAG: molybdopterin molybdotransferase MoeA [Gammaproteobacteria bacterium]|nr:molybdopterin molybdotransferase MoeA [Gammaproteobacteria bacterium]NIR82451.1 molybdopterin molybdotransferase MoeA [Gammaproteobacteria bacterium]NIR88447.1 molybdopterin molybdotransferase MoeA [Gammaproteobacteria bacterium]NIU03587.1 molybdopterin molybdotransferase MoeA [Gammaproteobacteria bacterium]NIV50939.1 molybdopterin molybdenumtransferase MoeA [Gammaproteobacteria bacterium]